MTPWEFVTGHLDGTQIQTGLAGTLGGLVRWMTMRSDWRTGMIGLAVGGISSLYITPLIQPLLAPLLDHLTDDPFQKSGFAGFIIGIGGITITGTVIDVITARRKKIDADSDTRSGEEK